VIDKAKKYPLMPKTHYHSLSSKGNSVPTYSNSLPSLRAPFPRALTREEVVFVFILGLLLLNNAWLR
jgi:hypothetical protein